MPEGPPQEKYTYGRLDPTFFYSFTRALTHLQTASGILYNAWDAHYRQVNVLRFTNDGSALVSGSDDSAVNVWSVSRSIWPSHFLGLR